MDSAWPLVYVAFNSQVVALRRDTGEVVWEWKTSRWTGFPAILIEGDDLFVSVQGYTYCLNARTGNERWLNELTGRGFGTPMLATRAQTSGGPQIAHEEAIESMSE